MKVSFKEWQECKDKKLELGQRIAFNSRKDLEAKALLLSANGYGVALIGYTDIAASILTITAVPGGGEGEDH